jgi:hypothetical protein
LTLSVSQMAANEAEIELPIAGDTLKLTYYPGKVTPKVTDQFTTLDGICQSFKGIIKKWDLQLTPDDKSMWPLDAESLSNLGIDFLREVALGIVSDMRPN